MNKKISKIVLRDIKIPVVFGNCDYDAAAVSAARKKIKRMRFRYPINENSFSVFKKSVDARKRDAVCFVYSIIFSLKDEVFCDIGKYEDFCNFCKKNNMSVIDDMPMSFERVFSVPENKRPVIAGFGPCGMFLALVLAKSGFRPIVIERGDDADTRAQKVEAYWKNGKLDTESNVQFGEGGAGTFSDGKLMTRINDRLCSFVLETFFEHGADKDILTNAKPHVGTDKLRLIVKNIRKTVEKFGGNVFFNTKLESIVKDSRGSLKAVVTNRGEIITDTLFLAVGHSARDTFINLMNDSVQFLPKPFSVGVRVEHLQSDIDVALYGKFAGDPALPKGEYSLSRRFGDDAVYSFCMCPGGTVVASASEDCTIVTNGMSYSARDGKNANSAIAVSVNPNEYGGTVVGAIEYQRKLERDAFVLAGSDGSAPIENLGHFLGRTKLGVGKVEPTYTGKTKLCSLTSLFPVKITNLLSQGFILFEKSIEGFSCDEAILTAPETRTSSPVRIPRSDDLEAAGCRGLYPCGEGAGYAGGITSAAVDGVRCALSYITKKTNSD